jgi:hypothetical protein
MSDNFESYALYSGSSSPSAAMITAGWATFGSETSGLVEIVDGSIVGSSGKVLKLSDTGTGGGIAITRSFTSTQITYARIRFRTPAYSIDADLLRLCPFGSDTPYIWLLLGMSGSHQELCYYSDAIRSVNATTIPLNTWLTVELKAINWVARTYDVYLNGVFQATVNMVNVGTGTTVSKLIMQMSMTSSTQTGTMYYDDLYII